MRHFSFFDTGIGSGIGSDTVLYCIALHELTHRLLSYKVIPKTKRFRKDKFSPYDFLYDSV